LPIEVDREIAVGALGHRMLALGLAYNLSSYDASYLELAMRRGLPLATEDERLAHAAVSARIELVRL
jgi:predicted nucleic acid-binding protein